jgi:DNA polymerase sigma
MEEQEGARKRKKSSSFKSSKERRVDVVDLTSEVVEPILPYWMKKKAKTLHQEIEEFVNYITPTVEGNLVINPSTFEERVMRKNVVSKIKQIVKSVWPKAKAKVFGSLKSDLLLPTSDIVTTALFLMNY